MSLRGTKQSTFFNNFRTYREEQTAAELGAKTATAGKCEHLETLTEALKTAIKRAGADIAASFDKLVEIGWSARQTPEPVLPPSFPGNLRSIAEGQGSVSLAWEKPSPISGGSVRNYVIERCQQLAPGGENGPW